MIIQCEQCDTRFRMADEKLKPGGTKVRCSKCKHIFTVMPPAPEPEPAPEPLPVEPPPAAEPQPEQQEEITDDNDAVDFGSFNMEQVAGDSTSTTAESAAGEDAAPGLDFSGQEEGMDSGPDTSGELADDFSFASTETPSAEDDGQSLDVSLEPGGDASTDTQTVDFSAAFEEGPDEVLPQEDPGEFAFDTPQDTTTAHSSTGFESAAGDEAQESAETSEFDFGTEETDESGDDAVSGPGEFSFGDAEETDSFSLDASPSAEPTQDDEFATPAFGDDGPGEFSFDDTEEPGSVSFDESPAFGDDGPGEFSFDDTDDASADAASQWDDDSDSDSGSFDFDEPQFETEAGPGESGDKGGDDELQFGEINFAEDDGAESPSFEAEGDFAGASLSSENESADQLAPESPPPASQTGERQSRERGESEQLAAPAQARKSPVSSVLRILGILLLLTVLGLGGLLGYFFYTDGGLDINRIVQRFPILEDYVGPLPASAPEQLIAINIHGSKYVNNDNAGQLLVIQGEAVNNFARSRSAITVKGVLLNAQGQTLFQQTVFCGNLLDDEDLQTMAFAAIEEAMNNQFGDSLSNMDVAAGSKIPFTIVFRNLPDGIANINVEVVDSKVGGS